jgi:hypothetical protein
VDHTMNLLVQIKHRHAENGPAMFGFHQLESKVVDRMAVTQPFGRPCQVGFGQFSSRLHGVGCPLRSIGALLPSPTTQNDVTLEPRRASNMRHT